MLEPKSVALPVSVERTSPLLNFSCVGTTHMKCTFRHLPPFQSIAWDNIYIYIYMYISITLTRNRPRHLHL